MKNEHKITPELIKELKNKIDRGEDPKDFMYKETPKFKLSVLKQETPT